MTSRCNRTDSSGRGRSMVPWRAAAALAASAAAIVLAIGAQFSQAWGQTTIVDNRTGASGLIAAELTARAGADGLR